jgi:mono/diheme cytochrome c family protein
MKRPLIASAIVLLVLLGFLGWQLFPRGAMAFAGAGVPLEMYRGPDPTGVPRPLRQASLVQRGAYLAKAADCEVCHTARGGQAFAGGFAFNMPFGTIYSTNITPDRATGIGAYNDAEFLAALKHGRRRDGTNLYPAMPYTSYARLSDSDALAIKAFLFSLKPVHAPAKSNHLAFPFDQRWGIGVWKLFFASGRAFQPRPDRGADWNRGAYLAEALGHCGECHTPRNLFYAPDNRRKFAGALTAGWRAYNISADPVSGIGTWRDSALFTYLHTGHAEGHGAAAGPMGEASDDSLSYLTPSDIHALVVYLRSIPATASGLPQPVMTPAPRSFRDGAGPQTDLRGEKIFAGACASCHDWTGQGRLTTFATLTGARAVNDPTATNVAQTVMGGVVRKTAQGTVFMPAFGGAYSDTEVAAVANYVTGRFGAERARLTAADVAALRKQTVQ